MTPSSLLQLVREFLPLVGGVAGVLGLARDWLWRTPAARPPVRRARRRAVVARPAAPPSIPDVPAGPRAVPAWMDPGPTPGVHASTLAFRGVLRRNLALAGEVRQQREPEGLAGRRGSGGARGGSWTGGVHPAGRGGRKGSAGGRCGRRGTGGLRFDASPSPRRGAGGVGRRRRGGVGRSGLLLVGAAAALGAARGGGGTPGASCRLVYVYGIFVVLCLLADGRQFVDAGDGEGPVADGEADALGRAGADVAGGEDAGEGGFQRTRLAVGQGPAAGLRRRRRR